MFQAQEVNPADKEHRVNVDLLALLALEENVANQVKEDVTEQMDNPEPKDPEDQEVLLVHKDHRVLLDQLELKENVDLLGKEDKLALLEKEVVMAHQVV